MPAVTRFALLLVLLISAGCTTQPTLSPSDAAQIQIIRITPNLGVPSRPTYEGPEQAWGQALGGIIGGMIVESASDKPMYIRALMDAKNIDMQAILRDAVTHEAQAHPFLGRRLGEQGETMLDLKIENYGIQHKFGFSGEYGINMAVEAQLRGPGYKVLWKDKAVVMPDFGLKTNTFEEFVQSDDALRERLKEATQAAVAEVLGSMTRN